jgi:hypothetical protein
MIPPVGRGNQAVKEQAFVIGSLIAHRNPQRFTAVRARRLDPPVRTYRPLVRARVAR